MYIIYTYIYNIIIYNINIYIYIYTYIFMYIVRRRYKQNLLETFISLLIVLRDLQISILRWKESLWRNINICSTIYEEIFHNLFGKNVLNKQLWWYVAVILQGRGYSRVYTQLPTCSLHNMHFLRLGNKVLKVMNKVLNFSLFLDYIPLTRT